MNRTGTIGGPAANHPDELVDQIVSRIGTPRQRHGCRGGIDDGAMDHIAATPRTRNRQRHPQSRGRIDGQINAVLAIVCDHPELFQVSLANLIERGEQEILGHPYHRRLLIERDDMETLPLHWQADKAHIDRALHDYAALISLGHLNDLKRNLGETLGPDPAPFGERDPRHEPDGQAARGRLHGLGHLVRLTYADRLIVMSQTMKPLTAATKLGIYLPAAPEEFQNTPLTRAELDALRNDPPPWLQELRRNGPFPRDLIAQKLGVSRSGLARAGITDALDADQIGTLLADPPEWLIRERQSLRDVVAEKERLRQND